MKFDVVYEIFFGYQEGLVCENIFLDVFGYFEYRFFVYIADMFILINLLFRFIIFKRSILNLK